MEHILGECERLDYSGLRTVCGSLGFEMNVRNLLAEPKLKVEVEKFLYKIFKQK